ncbi:nitroreductase family protein [Terrisporobacter sp.]
MEFIKVITDRYACKKFDGRKVEKAQMDAVLEAGRLAPTAKNLQEQHLYVIESEEMLAKIDEVTPCRYGAGTVIVVAFDKTNVFTYPGGKRDSGVEDATIVATHLMLGAKNEGLETCWINFFDPEVMAEKLGLPENEEVLMMLDIGYAAEGAPMNPLHTKRKELSETVTYM